MVSDEKSYKESNKIKLIDDIKYHITSIEDWKQLEPVCGLGEDFPPPGWCSHRTRPPSSGLVAAASAVCCSWGALWRCLEGGLRGKETTL